MTALFLSLTLTVSMLSVVTLPVMAASDAFTIKSSSALPSASMTDVAYGNGVYVAVGYNGAIIQSSDANTWTNVKTKADVSSYTGVTDASSFSFSGIAFGAGTFVAGGSDGVILTSSDGTTWTQSRSGITTGIGDVRYLNFNGVRAFYALSTGCFITSTDGITWNEVTPSGANTQQFMTEITVGNSGTRLAVGESDGRIFSTTDGTAWTVSQPTAAAYVYATGINMLKWVNDRYIISDPSAYIWTSTDLSSFTLMGSPFKQSAADTGSQMFNGFYDGSLYYLFGFQAPYGYGAVYTSPNASDWTMQSYTHSFVAQNSEYLNGKYFRLGNEGMLVSSDGQNWDFKWGGNFYDVTYDGTKYVAAGSIGGDGAIWTSTDLKSWSSAGLSSWCSGFNAVACGGGKYVAAGGYNGSSTAAYATSNNGTAWTTQSTITNSTIYDIAYGSGEFVAVGTTASSAPYLETSSDGITWTTPVLPETSATGIWSVTYLNNQFIALGCDSAGNVAIWTSPNGATWDDQSAYYPGTNESLTNITYCGGKYVLLGYDNSAYELFSRTSTDLTDWSSATQTGCYCTFNVGSQLGKTGNNIYTIGYDSAGAGLYIYYSGDQGATWHDTGISTSGITPISFSEPNGHLLITGVSQLVMAAVDPDKTPPSSPMYNPAGGATNVAVSVTPTLTFGEALYSDASATAMDASPKGVIKVYEGTDNGGTALTEGSASDQSHFTVGYDVSSHAFTVTFGASLKYNQSYYIELQANKVYDAAGNAIASAQGVTFKTAAPAAPTATTHAAGGVTLTGATLNGTVNANGDSTAAAFEYGTSASYGTTVTASQSPVTGTDSTSVSYTLTGLAPGTTYHYRVTGTNAGGTANGDDMQFTTLAPPDAPTLSLDAASDTGRSSTDGITNQTMPVFTGTAEAGTTVTLYDTGGKTVLGTGTAPAGGVFSIPSSALSQGLHSITAKAKNSDNLESSASPAVTVTVDTTPPAAPTIAGPKGTIYTDAPAITGTAEADSTVQLYDGGTPLGTVTAKADGSFSFTPSSGLSVGNHSVTATAADKAGNVSAASSAQAFTVSAVSPTYSITAAPTSIDFGSRTAGYAAAPDAQPVTVKNTGNQTVTLNAPDIGSDYTAGALSSTTVAPGGTATFEVRPKTGLAAGDHDATVTVTTANGTNAVVALKFTVNAITAATGLTVTTSVKTPVQSGVVTAAITPAAAFGHMVYYRVDVGVPAAPNTGDSITASEWTQNTHGAADFDISAQNGRYLEAVETDSSGKIVKWGVSAAIIDGYSPVSDSSLDRSGASFDKAGPSDITVFMTLNGNTLTGITKGSATLTQGTDYTVSGSEVTLKSEYFAGLNPGTAALVFHFSAGIGRTFSVSVSDRASSGIVSAFDSLASAVSTQRAAFGTLKENLNLPGLLKGVVDGVAGSWIKVTEWVSSLFYNPLKSGIYDFTPVLDSGYVLKDSGVVIPHIHVTVNSKPASGSSASQQPTVPKTETRVDPTKNTSTVTTVPDSVISNGGTTQISVTVPTVTTDTTGTDASLNSGAQAHVSIGLPENAIIQQLNLKQNVDVTLAVPTSVAQQAGGNVSTDISVGSDIFTAAKAVGSDVTVNIKDADTQQLAYTWTFKGSDLAKSSAAVTDVNISMAIRLTTEVPQVDRATPDNKGLVLMFDHSGVLPSTASVTFNAEAKGFRPGQTLYFYFYNTVTGQLEPQAQEYTVDANGNVTVRVSHCSNYVLLPDKARTITLDTRSYIMKPGDSYVTGIKLTGVTGAKIKAYSSTPGVAVVTVLNDGNVKAIGAKPGVTYIMIDIYDGKNKFLTHASVRMTVKDGVKPRGNSVRQYGIF